MAFLARRGTLWRYACSRAPTDSTLRLLAFHCSRPMPSWSRLHLAHPCLLRCVQRARCRPEQARAGRSPLLHHAMGLPGLDAGAPKAVPGHSTRPVRLQVHQPAPWRQSTTCVHPAMQPAGLMLPHRARTQRPALAGPSSSRPCPGRGTRTPHAGTLTWSRHGPPVGCQGQAL